MEDAIGELVKEALATRAIRRANKVAGSVLSLLDGTPKGGLDGIPQNDMKGLVGEIVAEAVLVECGFGEPLYTKWRHAGTSASKGIDIVMHKGDRLSAVESKHLHALRQGQISSSDIARAITSAFRQSGDRHTRHWLVLLRQKCVESAKLGGAVGASSPATATAMLRTARIIDKALLDWSVSADAVVMFDAQHGVDAKSIGMRLGPGTLQGMASPAAAVVSSIGGLRKATAHLIRRHC